MEDTDTLFEKRKTKPGRLIPFGFVENGDGYAYSVPLAGGQLEMTVAVAKDGKVSATVLDLFSNENYVLHRVPTARGEFVEQIRREYESVLTAVNEACFEPDVFKSAGAGQVIRYVREQYRDELEFLWPKSPDNAIFRRKDNAKWYAALLTVRKVKLGLEGEDMIEVIDLRINYFPGYHMNKKHWLTILLEGSVPAEEIFRRIDESFALAMNP